MSHVIIQHEFLKEGEVLDVGYEQTSAFEPTWDVEMEKFSDTTNLLGIYLLSHMMNHFIRKGTLPIIDTAGMQHSLCVSRDT